jgi:hypothetical protein
MKSHFGVRFFLQSAQLCCLEKATYIRAGSPLPRQVHCQGRDSNSRALNSNLGASSMGFIITRGTIVQTGGIAVIERFSHPLKRRLHMSALCRVIGTTSFPA